MSSWQIANRVQRRKRRSKQPPLRPSASSRIPGSPIFDNAAGSSRARSTSAAPARSSSRGGGGNTSLVEGLMFSHKPNPIFDTAASNSSRGEDYEVLNLSNARPGSNAANLDAQPMTPVHPFLPSPYQTLAQKCMHR